MKKFMSPSSSEIQRLVNVSLGKEKADLVIVGGDMVNVYTGELLQGWSVSVKGERIAYMGRDAGHTIGPETQLINATGKTLIPGLIDGHTHITYLYALDEFIHYAMKGGTTAVVTETIDIAFALGYQGIMEFFEASEDQPIKVFITVPPMSTISPRAKARAIDTERLGELLQRKEVVGLGEVYWSRIINGSERLCDLCAETLSAGKKIEGHSAGARGNRLVSYTAAGISSCHEPITVEETLERLRLGVYTMIREGLVRSELQVISKIKDEDIDFRRLILVSDGIGPDCLMQHGYMDFIVQRAIDFGFDPIVAIQMATLNVAEHFNLDDFTGGIAPGKYADILVIPDLHNIKAEHVISNGRIIASKGEVLVKPRKHDYLHRDAWCIETGRRYTPADFQICIDDKRDSVRVRVIDLVTDLVTREEQMDISALNGEIEADVDKDILKVAVVLASDQSRKVFVGLVKGFGIKKGAFATSALWDTCSIVVVGTNGEDMAGAVNRVNALRGGIAAYADGQVQAELALPIGGLISEEPMETIAQKLDHIAKKMAEWGSPLPDPFLTLSIFTTPAIPFLRISEEGLMDLKEDKILDFII